MAFYTWKFPLTQRTVDWTVVRKTALLMFVLKCLTTFESYPIRSQRWRRLVMSISRHPASITNKYIYHLSLIFLSLSLSDFFSPMKFELVASRVQKKATGICSFIYLFRYTKRHDLPRASHQLNKNPREARLCKKKKNRKNNYNAKQFYIVPYHSNFP